MPLKGKILNVEKARFDKMLQSAEVGTLITALGCGIGRDEFDISKLRYHHIVIMTDADVDGSHIRTLLLTFFYRQMPELIREGYVYIAQPPLYKVRKGKQERYVKDDEELNAYLLELAMNDVQLFPEEGASALPDEKFSALAADFIRVTEKLDRMERMLGRPILEQLMDVSPVREPDLHNEARMQQFADAVTDRLNRLQSETERYSNELQSGGNGYAVILNRQMHGNSQTVRIDPAFLDSADYQSIADFAADVDGLLTDSARVKRGEKEENVQNFKELMDWLMKESKRGLNIQRYKGLGEMNPDQLWETTMDPTSRRVLQVTIEDAMVADEVFDTLMGDQVDPRREFIQRNALSVANLDV